MDSKFKIFIFIYSFVLAVASYHEQYKVPHSYSNQWESYSYEDTEYIIEDLPVSWENAKVLCRGQHNGTLAILNTKEKAEFLSEALSESQFPIEGVWVGARRASSADPDGYRWIHGMELRRTASDVLGNDSEYVDHYPLWLNRTRVPVPEDGADCVAVERVFHDKPVFVDLPCNLDRPFVCERKGQPEVQVSELKTVRCRTGSYHVYSGKLNWHQAAAYCVLNKMSLANIGTMRCLKKLGILMLKTRPSIENAWVGAQGSLGKWTWIDSGLSIFQSPPYTDVDPALWPPMRDRSRVKQNGCLQLDRHASHPPVFLEARCERKMQFICYQAIKDVTRAQALTTALPSDDSYYYVLIKQKLIWDLAFNNCRKMNGTLASLDNADILIQLLLLMGENKDEPLKHIWVSGRLNISKDINTDTVTYNWYDPNNGRKIPSRHNVYDTASGLYYIPPWLDEEFSAESPCLNLDRQDHLNSIVYGLPCSTAQFSICMIEKQPKVMTLSENIKESTPAGP